MNLNDEGLNFERLNDIKTVQKIVNEIFEGTNKRI